MFLRASREANLLRQRNALTWKLGQLNTSTLQSDRRKGWKIVSKLKSIDRELSQVRLPF